MPDAELLAVDPNDSPAERVNVFVHGYRSAVSRADVEAALDRVRRTGVVGENYLLRWRSGRWADSATVAGLRAAYKATRIRYALSPWSLLMDAGIVGATEAAQFKRMERRAEQVGKALPEQLAPIARGRPVNLIGHSLGARVVHYALGHGDLSRVTVSDVVLLAGAADLNAANWHECVARIEGRLVNAYSRSDKVLKITPDLRKRVGMRPMPNRDLNGVSRVENHHCKGVGHVQFWTRLPELLPTVWPAGFRTKG